MGFLAISAVIGLVCGHLVRRVTPALLSFKKEERQLPFKWPWLELLSAVLFVSVANYQGTTMDVIPWFILCLAVIVVTSTDAFGHYIVMRPLYLAMVLGLVSSFAFPLPINNFMNQWATLEAITGTYVKPVNLAGFLLAVLGGIMGYVLLEFVRRLFSRMVGMEVMGAGDSWVMAMVGIFLGPKMIVLALLPMCLIGILIGIYTKLTTGMPHTPFGPAIGIGGVVMLIYHEPMMYGIRNYQTIMAEMPPWLNLVIALVLVLVAAFMILRIIKKRNEYEQQIEASYQETDEKMES
jgi:prepilin signal peptidase PulO-like enzyme (type II secretory pathway)